MSAQTVIIIPSHLPLTPMFLETLPQNTPVILVHDSDQTYSDPLPDNIQVLNQPDQQQLLGKHFQGFMPFRGSSACRIAGHFLAYKNGWDVIMLDHDCFPKKGFVATHQQALSAHTAPAITSSSGWINPLQSSKWYSRGFPYEFRYPSKQTTQTVNRARIVAHMGLWENVLDINGIDKVMNRPPTQIKQTHRQVIAQSMFPISGMNTSLKHEVIPAYLLFPNITFHHWTISRHDDIWGGYILQRLIDQKGDHIIFGLPIVYHAKETNQQTVLHHEHHIHLLNHHFHSLVDQAIQHVVPDTYLRMMVEFSHHFANAVNQTSHLPPHYQSVFRQLASHLDWWSSLLASLSAKP